MTINVEKETDIDLGFNMTEVINKVIDYAVTYVDCPYEVQVEVLLTDNAGIHEINKSERDIDSPTDVLSFPMLEFNSPQDFSGVDEDDSLFDLDTGELMLGDIVISLERVISQAEEYGHSTTRELAFLVAHSMMHLFGYDHMTPDEAALMEQKQSEILDYLNIKR